MDAGDTIELLCSLRYNLFMNLPRKVLLNRSFILISFVLFLFSCAPGVFKGKHSGRDYFGQGRSGEPHGFGIIQSGQDIYIGKFKQGKKHGWFKIVSSDGTIAYKFFWHGKIWTKYKDLYVNSDYIASGNQISSGSSKKAIAYSLKGNGLYFGDFSGGKPSLGVNKTDYGLSHVGFQPVVKNGQTYSHLLLPTRARLNGYKSSDDSFNANMFVTHTGQVIRSAFIEEYKSLSWGDVKSWTPTTNPLAPQVLVSNFKNGDLYIGEGRSYKAHGYGYLKKKNGLEVWGWFTSNKLDGDVIERRNGQNLYAGSYKNGKRHGLFFSSGTSPKYNLKKTINLNQLAADDLQFKKLENWFYENKDKEGSLAPPPFEEDYELNVDVHKIVNFDVIYNEKSYRPSALKVKNKKVQEYFPKKKEHDPYFLALESGVSSPGHQGPLTTLGAKSWRLNGTAYRNGREVGAYKSKKLSPCDVEIGYFRYGDYSSVRPVKFYGVGCAKGKKTFSSKVLTDSELSIVIYNAKIKNGKLMDGEAHMYNYRWRTGFIGKMKNGKFNELVRFIRTQKNQDIYSYYRAGKEEGMTESPGAFRIATSNGKMNGKGTYYENGYLYSGKYQNGLKIGTFSFINYLNNTKGFVTFGKNGKRSGLFLERNKDGSIFERYSYINGKKEGQGLCRYRSVTEKCEFKNGKRVDSTYTQHKKNEELERENARQFLKNYYARKEREKEEARREEAKWKAEERRRKEVQARMKRARREQEDARFRSQYQQILNNQRNYTNFYSNYSNYGKSKSAVPAVNSKPATNSSGVKLTGSKTYKECELTQNYNGIKFATFYNCNDEAGTLANAQLELKKKIDHYAKTIRLQKERQAKADEEDRQYRNRENDACARHLRRGGNICDKICAGTSHAKDRKCKTGSF